PDPLPPAPVPHGAFDRASAPAGLAALRPDPAGWLRTFTERLGGYPTHVRGHPPLPPLVLWLLERAGLGGTGWAAAVVIAAGTSAAAAIAVTLRRVAGERAARASVPFVVLAPVALWIATAMDALFLAAGAWGTALLAIASGGRPARGPEARARGTGARWIAAAGAGLLLGCLPYLSYGLVPLFAVPLVVVLLCRPRAAVLAAAGAGLVVVPALFTVAGFWWPDGLRATLDTYLVSGGSARRPYVYFLFADLAVLGLLTGPAVARALPAALAAALRVARGRALPPGLAVAAPAGAALLAMLALDATGVTRGEVERIWVPFAAWLPAIAPLASPVSRGPAEETGPGRTWTRGWLAAQAVTALAVQALVLSEW
ncbi:hypothetical protein, partial [Actinomadura roseirufa]|uniref:hypothetical protein n=1 Tax=Actinomadura roseirufa TaxID=2094049 RepID=UPI0013F157CD